MTAPNRRSSTLTAAALALCCLFLVRSAAGGPAQASASHLCGTHLRQQPQTYRHVIWIVFENKSYGEIRSSREDPYISSLIRGCGLATNYFALAHPSLPNYIAMTSGTTRGITDDADPASHALAGESLFSQLGASWRAIQESMPHPCASTDSGTYAVRHNPPTYYTTIRSRCRRQDAGGPLQAQARFTFVTPNMCHDMHDCSVGVGDAWLAHALPRLIASSGYRAGGTAVLITWDEDDRDAANHVATIVLSPYTSSGTRRQRFDHYSLLATTESMLGLRCLRAACSARSMRSAFGL